MIHRVKIRNTMTDPAKKFFPPDFTDRERAIFEAGIALGSLFHSMLGLPATASTKKSLEKAFMDSFSLQPFRKSVKIKLRKLPGKKGIYGYGSVLPDNIEASVTVAYGAASVDASVRYVSSLKYPLMYVSKVNERKGVSAPRPSTRIRRAKALNKFAAGRD
ncbi:MAG: dihydroneopterin aldolase family protein [Candidatus Caldarchaeum sp.]